MSNGDCRIGDNGTVAACIDPISGSADPSAGAGVEANPGTLYVRTTGGVTSYWIKTGAGDTAWAQLLTQAFSGTLSATRFKATGAGTASLPAFALANEEGMYQEATNQLAIAVGGVRYVRLSAALLAALNASISATANVSASGALSAGQQLTLSGVQSTLLEANTDNLALTAVSTLRLTSTGAFDLTGITAGASGRYLQVENGNAAGGDAITLVHDATSTAANRFSLSAGSNLAIAAQGAVLLRYNGTSSRWIAMEP